MKKVTVIWSSPNRDGLTAAAKDRIADGLRDAGAEVQEIHLNGMKLEHCRACGNGWGTCNRKGICVIRDDFDSLTGFAGATRHATTSWQRSAACWPHARAAPGGEPWNA